MPAELFTPTITSPLLNDSLAPGNDGLAKHGGVWITHPSLGNDIG